MDNPADRSGLASRRLVVMIAIETPEIGIGRPQFCQMLQ
jgi:hypothetical protein